MEDTTGFTVFDRLKIASSAATDAELAVTLKLTKQSIAQARAKKVVPASWVPKAAELFNVSTDWLFFGRGPMRPDCASHAQESIATPEAGVPCARCAKLEKELGKEREERRELSKENRQWAIKMEQVLRENGELRERCAKFEERQSSRNPVRGAEAKYIKVPADDSFFSEAG